MATENSIKRPRTSGSFAVTMQRLFTGLQIATYRLSGGAIGGRMGNSQVVLLTTIGRKTGKPRTTPLFYLADEDRIIVVASNGGAVTDPLWSRNLQANAHAQVQVGRQKMEMMARIATSEERARLWPRLVAMYSGYADYQARAPREIPVVILQRAGIMRIDDGKVAL